MNNYRLLYLVLSGLLLTGTTSAQVLSQDSVETLFRQSPSFTIFQDNYVVSGIPVNEKASQYNADVKFQISFKQRITNSVLPFNSYLFLTYTQVNFWDIYQSSSPFAESNYNPAIGLAKNIYKNGKFYGIAALGLEHQSNGKEGEESRSWNRLTAHYNYLVSPALLGVLRGWLPFNYRENPDILKYVGYGEAGLNWKIKNSQWILDLNGRKGTSGSKGSLNTALSYRFSRNQYLSLQWFTGYAESLIRYNEKSSMLRLGFVIKPAKLSLF